MKKLNHFSIYDGNITDYGLRHLTGLKTLDYLNIILRQRITTAATRRLREKLPNLAFLQTQLKKDSPRTPQTNHRPSRR